jgi:glycosyltransferase involved in cell wall biosynthesis
VIPNGANTEIYKPMAPDPELRRSLGLEPGQYVVTYTGLHGLAHGLETVLETAHLLRDQPEIVFLMIGDGPEKAALVQRAGELGLPNLIFHGGVPDRELPRYLALADVGLHTSRRLAVCRGALPVKMFSYMACRLPVVLAVEGEAAELLAQAQAGVVVPPESPEALAEAILRLRSSPEAAAQYGRRGLAYVRSAYSRQALASRLTSLLADVRSM